jgi:dihydropyrimidinase
VTTYDLVLRNCKVVDVSGMQECEIAIEGGKVVKLAKVVDERAERTIDCTGKLVVPGAIDGHVHFEMDYGPGIRTADDFRTGTESAAAGGVTTVIDFVTPMRGQSLVEAFEERLKVATGTDDRRRLPDQALEGAGGDGRADALPLRERGDDS